MNFKVGDKVYYLDKYNFDQKQFGTVTKIDHEHTNDPIQTVWANWDHDDYISYGWMPSNELFLEKAANPLTHWQKIIDALEAAIDSGLENCEYEEAIKLAKMLDEVKKNV